jgi:hypothetical protein
MLRVVIGFSLVVATATISDASAPGQPLTCEDASFLVSGLRAEEFLPLLDIELCRDDAQRDFLRCGLTVPSSRQDAQGSVYSLRQTVDWWEIWRTRADGIVELVLQLPTHRPDPWGGYDVAVLISYYLDPVAGALYLRLASGCGGLLPCAYPDGVQVCRIAGLVPMSEVIARELGLPPGLHRRSR